MKYLALAIALSLTAVPALARDQAAHDAKAAQHNIDGQRAAADRAVANEARNQALSAANAAAGLPHQGYDNRAADAAAAAAAHTAKADALLAGCPTCH